MSDVGNLLKPHSALTEAKGRGIGVAEAHGLADHKVATATSHVSVAC